MGKSRTKTSKGKGDTRNNGENNGDFVRKYRNWLSDYDRVMRDKATSYFFTNFPDSWDSSALWKMFNRYGKVIDIYVAFKRTKLGSKFGFVRFINIGDSESFEKRLKGIMIGETTIVINRATFMKVAGKSVPVNFNSNLPHQQARFHMEDFPLFLEEDTHLRSKLERCWVGKAKNFKVLQNAWNIVKNNGLNECNIKYMGGLTFLFEWPSREAAVKSLEANLICIQQWFDDVKMWKADGDSYGRLAWITFEGLQVLTRNLDNVKLITKYLGKLLEVGRLNFDDSVVNALIDMGLEDLENDSDINKNNGFNALSPSFNDTMDHVASSFISNSDIAQNCFTGSLAHDLENDFIDGPKGTQNLNRPLSINETSSGPLPDLNFPAAGNNTNNNEDKELDELLSSFQRIVESSKNELPKTTNKKRGKSSYKKLVVGSNLVTPTLASTGNIDEVLDDSSAMRRIGEQIGFVFQAGASGGILTMWDTSFFSKEQQVVNPNFLCVIGSWSGLSSKVGLLNIYGPQSSSLKEPLWSSIENLINSFNIVWIIFGDFNVVRSVDERAGSIFDQREANAFNDFISRVGLFDFPFGGRKFTRFDKAGSKLSKLDRFLVTPNLFSICGDAAVRVLCRTFSDHCPLLLKVDLPNFGPKPFKVFDKWIRDGMAHGLTYSESIRTGGYQTEKSCEWAVERDENTRYFHSILRYNYAACNIKRVLVDGIWCDSPNVIKEAAADYYAERFKEQPTVRPKFVSHLFRKLSFADSLYLESNFSMDEVKDAVWSCAGSKAPGPDGLNFNFIKEYWDVIKSGFFDCIKYFEVTGKFSNGCNPSFTVLIPKKNDPLGFSDYRPISPIGYVYKIILKILAIRLAKVISSIVGPNQTAFLAGRQILDGCLIANEIIRMANIEEHKLLLFKVDFEKSFDSVCWSFLHDIIRQMGFRNKWQSWIKACLSSASIYVLVNGSPSKKFKMERGIRQGDPLSPFLFLLVAEVVQISIIEACNKGIYKGVSLAQSGDNLSLLQYAVDALFFGSWSRANANNLIRILKCFEMATDLKVNLAKSRIFGVGVEIDEVDAVASSLGCTHDSIPIVYLGLPVGKK
ncbi:putative RNA-directed DNA polymerase, eukaryota, reverse transcriptase zinc-binding domain protein [Tanacetum coccineum]